MQTVIIPNVTVNSNASTVKIWCSLPNGVVDQIPFNDTILVSFANFPNCNDHCSNAIELTLGTTSASQTSFATANSAEDPSFSNCSGVTLENTVWYFFTTTAEGGDVTLTFQNTVCSPSSNGIQVSVDQLIGTPCDPAGYVNVFCSNSGSTNDIVWGPVNLPGNTTYYITIDGYANNDCDFQISLQGAVTPPPVPEDPVVSAIPNPICEGQSSTITATSAGAQFCYVYSDPVGGTNLGATPLVVSPTSTTTYYVEAVSDMGIVNAGGRTPITITVNSQPDASISPVGTLCKNDSPIILTSSTAGGTWSGTGITDSANGIFNPALANTGNNLISYEVTVNGCTATHNIIIVVNENPMPNVNPSNSEICSGDFVTLTASGGNNYLWSTTENTASINVSPILNTTYYVTVTNAEGCSADASVTVTVNSLPAANITATQTAICEGGSTTLTASGGTGYVWNTGETTSNITVNPSATTTYYVTVINSTGCSSQASQTITVNSIPVASVNPGSTTICEGESVTITATGGTGYIWNTTETTSSITVTPTSTTTYSVTVSNAGGCTSVASTTINVSSPITPTFSSIGPYCEGDAPDILPTTSNNGITGTWSPSTINTSTPGTTTYTFTPDAGQCSLSSSINITVNSLPAANITATQTAICEGGSTTLTASGGTGYVWNTGETTSNITVNPSATTTYYVTVINSTGCSSQASQTITVNSIPVASVNPGSTTICEGESVTITATGGTGYIWNTTETTSSITVTPSSTTTYSVTVSNAAGCTVETISTINVSSPITPTFSSIGPYCEGDAPSVLPVVSTNGIIGTWSPTNINTTVSGTTTYNFTPSSGQCAVSSSIDITVNSLPQIQISPSNPYVCSGSDINLIASGGISYLWNNGNSSANINVQPLVNTVYSVTGTDVNGCSSIASVEVIVRLLPEIYVSSLVSPTCNGYQNGSISVSHTGTGNVSYNWTGYSTGNTLNNVGAGIYNVTGTDEYGCSSSLTITLTEPAELIACISSINNLSCQGNSDAYINVFAQGGTEPYTFVWDYNNFNGNIISGLPAGVYNLTVTDFNNCFDYLSIEILDAIPIKIIAEVSNVSCYGEKDGKILVNVQGGIAPYSYQINSNLYNTNLINSLNPGEYNIIVSDFNNCKSDTTVIISEPPPLNVSVVVTHPTCIGNNNGMIELGVSGGEYPYNYIVNGISSESPIIANLTHGSYFITVQDNNSCEYKLTNIMLTDYPEDCIRIPNAFTPNGDGINDFWVIENIELFPDAIVQVFNRWGQLVFETRDPNISWDGKFNNRLLPTGTYIYIININNNDKTYNGTVTIVR